MTLLEIEKELIYLNQQLKRKPSAKLLRRLERVRREHQMIHKQMRSC